MPTLTRIVVEKKTAPNGVEYQLHRYRDTKLYGCRVLATHEELKDPIERAGIAARLRMGRRILTRHMEAV